jgi:chromosomal replication initiator protein
MEKEDLWQAVLAQIQFHISPANFETWFKNTHILSKKGGTILIAVPNSFSREWIENKYHKLILTTLHGLNEEIKEAKYLVESSSLKTRQQREEISLASSDQLEFSEFKINKETNLNPRYTFDNFIVGSFNELPHAAATAVAKEPGLVYNPLFIYGGVGLGKTHLLQALGNEITKGLPQKRVKYMPAEKFTSEVVLSIRNHTVESLKEKYRQVDVLIIDDVQFLAGKEKTQEEFFHTFNALYEKNKQIILSSDRPPKAIPALEERLRSRFEGGMIADISLPDFETRMAILKAKAQERKVNFPEEILSYLANSIQRNIRELEGALNRLIAFQKLNKQIPDLEISKNLLKNIIQSPKKMASPKKIVQVVAEFYDLKERDILSVSRKREVVRPRQIAVYLLREELKSSFPFIGRKIGGKDHTTAIHSYEKIKKEMSSDENLKEELNLIRQRIFSA